MQCWTITRPPWRPKLMLHTKHALMLFPDKPKEKPKRQTKPKKRTQGRKPGPPAWPLQEQPLTPTALLLPKLEVKETGSTRDKT